MVLTGDAHGAELILPLAVSVLLDGIARGDMLRLGVGLFLLVGLGAILGRAGPRREPTRHTVRVAQLCVLLWAGTTLFACVTLLTSDGGALVASTSVLVGALSALLVFEYAVYALDGV